MNESFVWTPNTGQVRNAYGAHIGDCQRVSRDALGEFDRWLESFEASAVATALESIRAECDRASTEGTHLDPNDLGDMIDREIAKEATK